jgi:hypothetical protein
MLDVKTFQELLEINDLNKKVVADANEKAQGSEKKEKEKELSLEKCMDEVDPASDIEIASEPEEDKVEDFVYPSKLTKLEKMRKCIEY